MKKQLPKQIGEPENKLTHIRELLSSKQTDPEDLREMKSDYKIKTESRIKRDQDKNGSV